ncbi:ClpP/crotonase [Martensiomyces pterosporus]|nr:ClpP/crotonase [Martensiomyces pterosporus]
MDFPSLNTIKLDIHDPGVLVMSFNRPSRLNSMTPEAYRDWHQVMQYVHATPSLRVLIFTGTGRAYSAGQDLARIEYKNKDEEERTIRQRNDLTRNLTKLIITSPIPIIAAVNGPAIGYGCTTLALCDLVISVEQAIFRTPFAELAFCAEGCSSVTFPRILGPMVANDMILFGRTMTAREMHERGFVSRIVEKEQLMPVALGLAKELAGRAQGAIRVSRGFIRNRESVEELVRVNDLEMDGLYKCMISDDAKRAVAQVFAKLQAKSSGAPKAKI